MKKKALGRGLSALIPDVDYTSQVPNEIDIDRIKPNPNQPRIKIDDQALDELASSIHENGVLQPILVRPHGDSYQLVAGERRLLAAQRAGLLKVPAIIRDVPDNRMLQLALVENIQREQLSPIEEAQAYQQLMEILDTTQESLAARVGKERSTIANALRLLKLPSDVKTLLSEGKLTPGHARALLSANLDPPEMTRAAKMMVQHSWSVRRAERWAKTQPQRKKTRPAQEPNEAAAADRLRVRFGTKVEIVGNKKGAGQIRIHYYNPEDLSRIFTLLTENSQ